MATGTRWLVSAISPNVAMTAVNASSSGMPAATSEPNVSTRISSVIGSESVPAFAEVVPVRGLDSLLRARVAELADDEARMSLLRGGDDVDDRLDLVGRLVLVAADVEVDEHGASVFRDLACIAASERRADVLDGRQLRDARDDVADRRREGGLADAGGAALDQDALAGGLLEPVVEDPSACGRTLPARGRSGRPSSRRPSSRVRRRRR